METQPPKRTSQLWLPSKKSARPISFFVLGVNFMGPLDIFVAWRGVWATCRVKMPSIWRAHDRVTYNANYRTIRRKG